MANWTADFILRNNIDPARITQRAKHGIHIRKPGGEIEATFVGAPCHYQDSQGNWQAIDTALRKNTVSNRWYAPGVPVDISASDGSVSIYGGSWAHKTSRVGIWDSKKKTFAKAWDIPELGAVDGDSFVRSGKGWEYRQRVTESGLREELTLFQKPSISLPANTWLVLETYVPGLSAVADGGKGEWSADGMRFPLPSARDSSGFGIQSVLPCKRWKSGSYLYTGIQIETLEKAVYPVVVDPDFSGGTADGFVYASTHSGYSVAHSTSTAYDTTATFFQVGQNLYDTVRDIFRTALVFDSSSIPDEAIVALANITLTVVTIVITPTVTNDMNLVKADWSAYNPIGAANRESVYDLLVGATTDAKAFTLNSSTVAGSVYTSDALSTTWVSKTGSTYYGLVAAKDQTSTAPTNQDEEWVRLASANHATASYRPYLSATYYYPHHRTLLGVGT